MIGAEQAFLMRRGGGATRRLSAHASALSLPPTEWSAGWSPIPLPQPSLAPHSSCNPICKDPPFQGRPSVFMEASIGDLVYFRFFSVCQACVVGILVFPGTGLPCAVGRDWSSSYSNDLFATISQAAFLRLHRIDTNNKCVLYDCFGIRLLKYPLYFIHTNIII